MAVAYGSQDNPYVEFPFDRITEVHWGGALAVEFGDGDGPPVDPPAAPRGRLIRGTNTE